jgi:hypothetical protein
MDKLIEGFVKFFLILLLAPIIFALAAQLALGILTAILPWLIAVAVVGGAVAGLTAGLVLRRRLPPPGRALPPSYEVRGEPIRRPRGRDRDP